jgi:hypothetical protein
MSPELEIGLVREFPEIFRDYGKSPEETCMSWGCEHSDGWYGIIRGLCRTIAWHVKNSKEPIDFKFSQVKEKFGTLRVYTHGTDDYIDGCIDMAEAMSAVTCEVTGAPGEMCRKGHWYRTLSREQAAKDGYTVCSDEKAEEEAEGI